MGSAAVAPSVVIVTQTAPASAGISSSASSTPKSAGGKLESGLKGPFGVGISFIMVIIGGMMV